MHVSYGFIIFWITSVFLPALYIELTVARFQSFGTIPCFNAALNSKVKAGEMSSTTSLENLPEIPSGPVVLFGSIFERSFLTPFRVTRMLGIVNTGSDRIDATKKKRKKEK